MEVSINKENNEKNKVREMSQFCETLMRVTGAVGFLRQPNECAIVLCADGKTMSSRKAGMFPDVLNMVYNQMVVDDDFAELIIEASILYSKHLQGKPVENTQTKSENEGGEEILQS